jgi:hypothetical protein
VKKILNQKGQAIFEFIIFIPFLAFLYMMFYTVGNSINGSINQQKAVRGYYYNLIKGNSYLLTLNDLEQFKAQSVTSVGFMAIAFKEHGQGNTETFAPCFRFTSMFKGGNTESCDGSDRQAIDSTMYIRLFNAYGVCGPLYVLDKESGKFDVDQRIQMSESCSLKSI